MPDCDGLEADAALLFDAVREAGDLAMTLFRRNVRQWKKHDGSHVTEADLQIDAFLASRLREARADYGWLSEETADHPRRLSCRKLWIVDPIDGTRDFIHGGGDWCVAAALVVDGSPAIAAICRPARGEFYSSLAGGGAYLDGARLAANDGAALAGARIALNSKAMAALAGHGIAAEPSGALPLQLRLAQIAAGRLDGALSLGNRNDWDLAAGDLLVRESGGKVSDTSAVPYVCNRQHPWQQELVAAGAKRHAMLINALGTP